MTLGNYLGAIINWKKQIEQYDENFFFLAGLHSLTVLPDPADAANLTQDRQVASISRWLCSL